LVPYVLEKETPSLENACAALEACATALTFPQLQRLRCPVLGLFGALDTSTG